MSNSCVFNIASLSTRFRVSVSNQNFTDGFILEFDFFSRPLLRHLQQSALFTLLCIAGHSCSNLMPLGYDVLYSDSKTNLKVRCHYGIKNQLFEGAQNVFSTLKAMCCMLPPHNPYRLPQHYKRHICGLSCTCEHQFFWISPIF